MMKLSFRCLPIVTAMATLAITGALPAGVAHADGHRSEAVTVYFTRHARKTTQLNELGAASSAYSADYRIDPPVFDMVGNDTVGSQLDEVCGDDKCAEVLSDRGEQYADLLADFFDRRGIAFDAVYSSHKERTRQTVAPTAALQGLGDVIRLPAQIDGVATTELNPQGTSVGECATLEVIRNAAPGSTLLIAGHSGTLYDIMGDGNGDKCDGLGLLSDDEPSSSSFPKKDGKVANFNDLWKVTVRSNRRGEEVARLNYRINLQPVRLNVVERVGREARDMH